MSTGTEAGDLLINDGTSPPYELIDALGGDDDIRVTGELPGRAVEVSGGTGTDTLTVTAFGFVPAILVSAEIVGAGGLITLSPVDYDELATPLITVSYTGIERLLITGSLGHATDPISTGDSADTLDLFSPSHLVLVRISTGGGRDDVRLEGASDHATVYLGAGDDRLSAFLSGVISRGVEAYGEGGNDVLIGCDDFSDQLDGGDGADRLEGRGGRDRLDGGRGADTLIGGDGDDRYFVDNLRDLVVEQAGQGRDIVTSTVDFRLSDNVEDLTLAGLAAVTGTGNALANVITGNAAANRLDGGLGDDRLVGGAGDDLYVVDSAGDVVMETAAADGLDYVRSSVSFTLPAFVEQLALTGSSAIDAVGNAGANVLIGNMAANLLDGRAGADRMAGGLGDDTYVVDDSGDRVVERSGEGSDTVRSKLSYQLDANLENLVLIGNGAIDGTGNDGGNGLTGNSADNQLRGGGGDDSIAGGGGRDRLFGGSGEDVLAGDNGNDELHGGEGSDELTGGAGLDGFWFDTALATAGVDQLLDFASVDDTLYLSRGVFTTIAKGVLAASAFQLGAVALDGDDRILYDAATGRIFYDAAGVGGADAILFATVAANAPLTNLDFVGA